MSFSANYPTSRPALNLNFARSKVLDPRITFTRASTATYYDGVTTAKAEENLLLRSQDFTTSWSNVATSDTADTTVAPDGTTTADTITATGTERHYVQQTSSSTAGTQRVFSCFVKAGTNNYVQLGFGTSVTDYANFDVTSGAGAVGTVGATATASIVDAGNGWFRCIVITSNATASALCFIAIIQSSTDTRLQSFVAAGTETIILWGAQLEQRDAVTSYTATTTQTITNYIPVLLTAANNVSRFDHNPTTGESLGLLIEEQRTNLFPYSEDFADAAWGKTRASITSNTIVAPDGTLTGDKLVEDTTATNTHLVSDNVNLIANTSYTATVYVKAAERTRVRLQNSSIANWTTVGDAYFDLSAGTIVSGTGSITPISNGWYRCSINGTFGGANAAGGLNIFIVESGTTTSYTGDGYSGIYLWGAQLEAGAFPTSYIATVAATVTRNADAASMTGTNFSSWYNQSEGTLFAEASIPFTAAVNRGPVRVDDGTDSNRIMIRNGGSASQLDGRIVVNGSSVVNLESAATAITANTNFKAALAYAVDNYAMSFNGGTPLTDTSGVLPIGVNRLLIGNTVNSTTSSGSLIRRIAYYPTRLTNAQLQALTT